jgi:hypothetical protein
MAANALLSWGPRIWSPVRAIAANELVSNFSLRMSVPAAGAGDECWPGSMPTMEEAGEVRAGGLKPLPPYDLRARSMRLIWNKSIGGT